MVCFVFVFWIHRFIFLFLLCFVHNLIRFRGLLQCFLRVFRRYDSSSFLSFGSCLFNRHSYYYYYYYCLFISGFASLSHSAPLRSVQLLVRNCDAAAEHAFHFANEQTTLGFGVRQDIRLFHVPFCFLLSMTATLTVRVTCVRVCVWECFCFIS